MGKRLTQDQFINKCIEIHKDVYGLSKVVYVNMHTKIEVICKLHGSFMIAPNHFLKGTMCSFCNKDRLRALKKSTLDIFIEKANTIHEFIYKYDLSVYRNSHTKLKIQCNLHGTFEQTPSNHLQGHGCLLCTKKQKSKKEFDLATWLKNFTVVDQNYKPEWLGKKEIDIFLPEYNVGIEYNGIVYHHSTVDTDPYYQRYTKECNYHLDKYNLCIANKVSLLHIFEFEDLEVWKENLLMFLNNPNAFKIVFENTKRNYIHNKVPLLFYGISKILRGDLEE